MRIRRIGSVRRLSGGLVLSLLLLVLGGLTDPVYGEDGGYRLGDGDVIRISVYDQQDLDTQVRVNNDGTILFPLVGSLNVKGLTVAQVAERLGARLADGYIVNPQVAVFIEEFRSKKVLIMGQVKTPGLYELNGPITLLEMISKAGGLNAEASDKVIINRKTGAGGEEQQIVVNLNNLFVQGEPQTNFRILDGDNILVGRSGIFYVSGQVKKPDAYRFEEGTTVIKGITMAGGFTNLAAQGRVKIIRKIDGKEEVLDHVSIHDPILPEDVIVIPESFF